MQALKRYWYLFTLLFALLGFILGGWGWIVSSRVLPLSGTSTQATMTTKSNQQGPLPAERTMNANVRLLIPAIGVDAPLEAVGITSDGAMDVPTQHKWDGVGWYKYGPYPGEIGSSVVAGHFNRPGGAPGIFGHLHNLHPGDIVLIKNVQGSLLHFRVTALTYYATNNAPIKRIFGNKAGKFLNLITCTEQPRTEQQSSSRLVVYTKLF